MKYANGDFYKGEFVRDKRQGWGKFQNAKTKEIYEGAWRDDERSGEGTVYQADGTEIRANWRGSEIVGKTA